MRYTSSKNSDTSKETDDDIEAQAMQIFEPVTSSGGNYSVKIENLSDGSSYSFTSNSGEKFVSASLIKLFVAATVYENYDSVCKYDNYDGETDYLLEIMISQSDNVACNTLIERLGNEDTDAGMKKVNKFCTKNNFSSTQINRLMLDFNGKENYTSVDDVTAIVKDFYNGNRTGGDKIVGFMKNQQTRTKIPAGIPDGVTVANKTGELSNVENDTAIVYSDNGTYIISVMTDNLSDTSVARTCIADFSSYIYNLFTK